MANRFPLILDTSDENKIKELPTGDNLDLTNSNIFNVGSIQATGTLTVQSVVVNGTALSDVATSGDYGDLTGTPIAFSGNYNDLSNKPSIPTTTRDLTDVQDIEPTTGSVLQYNGITGRYEPVNVNLNVDLSLFTLGDIGNVILDADTTNQYLKYYSGAWRGTTINYNDVTNKPVNLSQFINDAGFITSETDSQTLTLVGSDLSISNGNTVTLPTVPTNVSELTNDAGYITAETDSQTLSLVGTDLTITNGNTVDLAGIVGDSVGNFTFASSVIDTDDSSAITMTPAVVMSSDLTVENDLTVAGNIVSTSTGTPELFSESNIHLTATTRVEVTQSPFKLASFTTTERDALTAENGDMIYNTDNNRFEAYVNGAWVIIDHSPIV